jgi:hypothetical protein
MRVLFTFICLIILSGCSHSSVATGSGSELQHLVGQSVTLSGQFDLTGKIGPYIRCNGESVYLVPHGSFAWGSDYERMQGKVVSVTGVLHLQHYERAATSNSVAQVPDYFYFDAETARVRLE